MRKQESEVIALVIPDIENPYFTELARGVEDVASQAGFSVVLCNTDSQIEKESTYLQIAISEHMAGVILAAASDHTNLDDLVAIGRPVVAVDRGTGYDIDGVIMANRTAGQAATEHLVQAGYRRIACITGPQQIETAYERAQGWRGVIARYYPDVDADELLRYSTFRVDGGREVMEELLALRTRPTRSSRPTTCWVSVRSRCSPNTASRRRSSGSRWSVRCPSPPCRPMPSPS